MDKRQDELRTNEFTLQNVPRFALLILNVILIDPPGAPLVPRLAPGGSCELSCTPVTCSSGAMRSARLCALWLSKVFRAYLTVATIIAFTGFIGPNFGGLDNFWTAWGGISLILLVAPFAIILGIHNTRTRQASPKTSHYELTADAFRTWTDDAKGELDWKVFSKIEETDKYIFLTMKTKEKLVFHKTLISGTTVNRIRTLLQSTGVPIQKWKK